MVMWIGIIGLPYSGKTTLFELLSQRKRSAAELGKKENTAVVKVWDPRVDFLSKFFKPKKTTYATLKFTDIKGLSAKATPGERNKILEEIQNVDALLWVIRAFDSPSVPWESEKLSASQQFEEIKTELMLRDMSVAETRINRLENAKRKLNPDEEMELKVLKKIYEYLESEKMLYSSTLGENELRSISSLGFFTLKPCVAVINVDEEKFKSKDFPDQEMKELSWRNSIPLLKICAEMEEEIMELEEGDRKAFLEDLGVEETGINRLTKVLFSHVGLISFFTVGEDEVRAWQIKTGTPAKKAAGKIHSDMERGFIRAEIVKYDDFKRLGSMKEVKSKGLMKLIGKNEIIEDGDIMEVRFNV